MGLEASLSRNMDRYDGKEKTIRETAAKTTKRERTRPAASRGDGCTGQLIKPSTNSGSVKWIDFFYYLFLGVLFPLVPLLCLTVQSYYRGCSWIVL
ncbi:uncharacterized protein BDW70DRAFT_116303 [Aspergillus foveolatus]|uniref:uncharacterized protein n=1 Tax=Aspergillus foveolatus TaxID=210207 RepID=UPI003CCD288E